MAAVTVHAARFPTSVRVCFFYVCFISRRPNFRCVMQAGSSRGMGNTLEEQPGSPRDWGGGWAGGYLDKGPGR